MPKKSMKKPKAGGDKLNLYVMYDPKENKPDIFGLMSKCKDLGPIFKELEDAINKPDN